MTAKQMESHRLTITIIACAAFLAIGLTGTLTAQPTRSIPVGIVDVNRIVDESALFKSAVEQAKAKRDALQSDLDRQFDELEAKMKTTANQADMLSEEQKQQQSMKFRAERDAIWDDSRKKSAVLEAEQRNLLKPLLEKANVVIEEIAKANSLELIVKRSSVAYHVQAMDITGQVIDKLDKEG